MRYKAIYTLLLIAAACLPLNAAETARSVLKHVVERMSSHPVEAFFDIKANGVTQTGMITISGDRFSVITDDISTWYDGKTQWTLAKAVKEVNITEPSHEELSEINPLLILSSLSSGFNAEMAGTTTGAYEILLASRDKNTGIASARVRINASTWFPEKIIIHTTAGGQFTVDIKSIKNLNNVDPATFRFNQSAHPGIEVIDLRDL